ncbi:MAG: hypothetical protein BYD32DRAFT_428172 [Podila humilis]|nr:MAG: hypothetical protein BYD32DRAFT_428172 [Podila humilis]
MKLMLTPMVVAMLPLESEIECLTKSMAELSDCVCRKKQTLMLRVVYVDWGPFVEKQKLKVLIV